MASSDHKTPNRLVHESSPYLLQHAYNPVAWYPWGREALDKAKAEDKPIIVSIGYSSCHWCHVMERESFESEEIAEVMNKHFINIKVDREERPDVDQIYMEALQSMNLQGGWPLNVFLTPEAKPFYGGTYFPPSHWMNILQQIQKAFTEHREDLEKAANDFTRVLNYSEAYKYSLHEFETEFTKEDLDLMYGLLEQRFDKRLGGTGKAPKFPMPSIYFFLMRYFHITHNEGALRQVKLTLDKMAMGGIYDQIGGGFARYSTDEEWFAPHFEKMLYDNGQLVSLYAEAYALTGSELYREVVYETIGFLEKEMTSPEGGFYSALDADSEGIEGKFYVWTGQEINDLLGKDATLFNEYYNVNPEGNWEHDYNILHRNLSDLAFANKHKLSPEELRAKLKDWKERLLSARTQRIRPGLDDKVLASWNGMMLHGLVDAYRIFDEERFLNLALRNADFIEKHLRNGKGLFRTWKNGKASIEAYLEDYAFIIQAYLNLYQATFEEKWLLSARDLTGHVLEQFYDGHEEMFFFTSQESEALIARKKEIFDNVIPASNSVMATNLFLLGKYFDDNNLPEVAERMLARMKKLLVAEPSYLSNWGCLMTYFVKPVAEVAIAGKDYLKFRKEMDKSYHPGLLFAGTAAASDLPLLQQRHATDGKTMIYVCYNRTCKLPVGSVEEALKLIG